MGAPFLDWLRLELRERPYISLVKVKAHTGAQDALSVLNSVADDAAKRAHTRATLVFPYPAFALPAFAVHDGQVWFEGKLSDLVKRQEKGVVREELPPATKSTLQQLNRLAYPPPAYPYKYAIHTYAAQTQVLIRFHQLPTGARVGDRFRNDMRSCAFCGDADEDEHHTFEICGEGEKLRQSASAKLKKRTLATITRVTRRWTM